MNENEKSSERLTAEEAEELFAETFSFRREQPVSKPSAGQNPVRPAPSVRPSHPHNSAQSTVQPNGTVIRPLTAPARPVGNGTTRPPSYPAQKTSGQAPNTTSAPTVRSGGTIPAGSRSGTSAQPTRPAQNPQSRPTNVPRQGSAAGSGAVRSGSSTSVPSSRGPSVVVPAQRGDPGLRPAQTDRAASVNPAPGRSQLPARVEASDNKPVRPSSHLPAQQTRTVKGDFEIDYEATNSRKKKEKETSYAADSATSAVMSLVKAVVYIVAVICVSIALSVFVIKTANDVFAFVKDDKIVTVTIPEYATMEDVANVLHDAGAIKYPWAFKLWGNLKDDDAVFIAGTYEIQINQNYDYLRAQFKKSIKRGEIRLTIPEGYTVDEIIELFVSNGIGTYEGFADVIQHYDFDYRFLEDIEMSTDRIWRLEGYLFPDTYNFYTDSSEVTALSKLLDNFDRKFISEYYDRCEDLGMTVDEVITLASMVEKEARYADELGDVSSVFHNRIRYRSSFPYLDSDATIMYAIQHDTGARLETMTGEDTEYVTPYNTYKNRGLPPSAIANPGLNAIRYTLYPNDTNYFYFVSDSRGRMLFAETEEEHFRNIITARSN